jgi:ABC-type enterobactin transport system permease subunit
MKSQKPTLILYTVRRFSGTYRSEFVFLLWWRIRNFSKIRLMLKKIGINFLTIYFTVVKFLIVKGNLSKALV